MSEEPVDWSTILKMTVLSLVFVNLIGFGLWAEFKCGVNRDTLVILESRGYTHIDIWGRDRLNCPRGYGSTRFHARSNGKHIAGVLCTEVFGDSVYVRVTDEY